MVVPLLFAQEMTTMKSEVTQRQLHRAETTKDVAIMIQGMFNVKRKVPCLLSLARCDGYSV